MDALMNKNISSLYTLDEAREILELEAMKRQAIYNEEKEQNRIERTYFIKQKLLGICLMIIATLIMFITKDATASIFLFPLGLLITLTKNKFLVNN